MRNLPLRVVLVVSLMLSSAALVRGADETAESAVWLLKKATLVHQNGMHNVLLRSLRQMDDPALKPLFSDLVQKRHPVLKIHGILGLGEIADNGKLDLGLIAEIKDTPTQAQLVSAAVEGKLIGVDEAKQLMTWPGLDPAVKIIVATMLVKEKALTDQTAIDQAMASDNLALRSMAALLKLELGGGNAPMDILSELSISNQSNRDNVRLMLLQTAVRYEFASITTWALAIAQEPNIDHNLSLLALRTAMRFKSPLAPPMWVQRFNSSTNQAERIRLAVLALDLADRLDAKLFDLMTDDADPVIKQMGIIGKQIATGNDGTAEILKLLELNHLLADKWTLQYAADGPIDKVKPLLVGIILNAQGGTNPERFRAQRLENTVLAAQTLAENATDGPTILHNLFLQVPSLTQEAMLVGLIRLDKNRPDKIIDGLTFQTDTADYLALLLRAKHGQPLDDEAMKKLAIIVRGGAGLQDPLRVQAAWIYLKNTSQDKFALASVLGQP
jgi:hypothetical protein